MPRSTRTAPSASTSGGFRTRTRRSSARTRRSELTRAERSHDVVVGARLEGSDARRLVRRGTDHDHDERACRSRDRDGSPAHTSALVPSGKIDSTMTRSGRDTRASYAPVAARRRDLHLVRATPSAVASATRRAASPSITRTRPIVPIADLRHHGRVVARQHLRNTRVTVTSQCRTFSRTSPVRHTSPVENQSVSLDDWGKREDDDAGRAKRLAGSYVAAAVLVATLLGVGIAFGGQIKKQVFDEEVDVKFVPPEPVKAAPPPPPPPPPPPKMAAARTSRRRSDRSTTRRRPSSRRRRRARATRTTPRPKGPRATAIRTASLGGTGRGGARRSPSRPRRPRLLRRPPRSSRSPRSRRRPYRARSRCPPTPTTRESRASRPSSS